jgi:hypothetical protein
MHEDDSYMIEHFNNVFRDNLNLNITLNDSIKTILNKII